MTNHINQFTAAMAVHGLQPSEVVDDGRLHRFDGPDEKRGKRSAWYCLHGDGLQAGAFGDWRTGLSETWCAKADRAMTDAERQACRQRIEQAKAEAAAERAKVAEVAAEKCADLWSKAGDVAADHLYVKAKGINPVAAKQSHDALLIPLRDVDGNLRSLQFIQPDGSKRFKSGGTVAGCYCTIGGDPAPEMPLLICEGWATACSLHEATGHPVAAAMNAGNLLAVAQALRGKLPDVPMIICADDDHRTDGNPGVTKGTEAAKAIGAWLAVPGFGPERPDGATDFNDLHAAQGIPAVAVCIESAASDAPQSPDANDAGQSVVDAAIARALAGDAGALFEPESITALRDLRSKNLADFARVRARIKQECRDVQIGELERHLRSNVDTSDERSMSDHLIELADERCELFHDPDNRLCAAGWRRTPAMLAGSKRGIQGVAGLLVLPAARARAN